MEGGTIDCGQFSIGSAGAADGFLDISGGTINAEGEFSVALWAHDDYDCNGTLNISGGTINATGGGGTLLIGGWADTNAIVNQTGGDINIEQWGGIAHGDAFAVLDPNFTSYYHMSGGTLSIGTDFAVGNGGTTGVMNVSGGSVDIAGTLLVPGEDWSKGYLNISETGVVRAGALNMEFTPLHTDGWIDLSDTGGQLIISGNAAAVVGMYTGTRITGNGSADSRNVSVIYDVGLDETIVSYTDIDANNAYDPTPVNNASGVSKNTSISWTAGDSANTHDVWFGTDPLALLQIKDDLPLGITTVSNVDIGGPLTMGQKYYWQVVETDVGLVEEARVTVCP